MEHLFKVNLKGVISILSSHLYSTANVFLRELTQNCCDAITARKLQDPSAVGEITYELIDAENPILMIEDNGCGLTEEEIHKFLATIGMSSKRQEEDFIAARNDFIGQFGIGLLSAFMVCDELVVYTRSHKEGSSTYEWKGRGDGTYSLREVDKNMSVGTRVFIHSSKETVSHFTAENIKASLQKYCRFLPHKLTFVHGDNEEVLNSKAPWDVSLENLEREALAHRLGEEHFEGADILDCFKIEGDFISGYAYLIPDNSLGGARKNIVYIRNMFINDGVTDLLPDWACLFGLVLNSNDLTPSASRESLYEDKYLEDARKEIEKSLNIYLQTLNAHKPHILKTLINRYEPLLKNIAAQNEEFLRIVSPDLTYESSIGRFSFRDLLDQSSRLYYVTDADEFHKVAPIASASGHVVINAGYSFEPHIMRSIEHAKLSELDIEALLSCIESPQPAEEVNFESLVAKMDVVLDEFGLKVRLCKFSPREIPLLYFEDEYQRESRRFKRYKEKSNDLFSSLLSDVEQELPSRDILVNISNPLIQKLTMDEFAGQLNSIVKLLYVQSLLLGRYPLGVNELEVLNANLTTLIEFNLLNK